MSAEIKIVKGEKQNTDGDRKMEAENEKQEKMKT